MELKPGREKRREYERAYRERNRDRMGVVRRARYRARIEEFRAKGRMEFQFYKERTRERRWLRHLYQTFGITPGIFAAMLDRQGGVCAICLRAETWTRGGRIKNLSVDHDHSTGAIRSLLCQACNQMIGFARDNPDVLAAAALYLRSWETAAEETVA